MSIPILILIAMMVVVAVLAVYRKIVARGEDDFVHLSDPSGQLITNQRKVARTLNHVDRVAIALTVATVLYGLALLGLNLYNGLMRPVSM